MPLFSQEDFTAENAQRLSVIIMPLIKKHALTSFRDLDDRMKEKFNKRMNEYIASLGEDWEPRILHDFNEVCYDEVFTDSFNVSTEKYAVPALNSDASLLLTEEQKEFLATKDDEYSKTVLKLGVGETETTA